MAHIESYRQDTDQRKTYSDRIFALVAIWLITIIGLVGLQGFRLWGFYLEPATVQTIIGATTAGVIGILLVVIRYLFPRR